MTDTWDTAAKAGLASADVHKRHVTAAMDKHIATVCRDGVEVVDGQWGIVEKVRRTPATGLSHLVLP
jgi:hypothetical protein